MTGNPQQRRLGGKRGGKGKKPPKVPDALRIGGKIENDACSIKLHIFNPLEAGGVKGQQPPRLFKVKAIIDTGATSTTISARLAQKIGITGHTRIRVGTAAGEVDGWQAPVGIAFLDLETGRTVSRVQPMAIMPMHDDVLFGMSDIAQGRLVVNGEAGEWKWILPGGSVGNPKP